MPAANCYPRVICQTARSVYGERWMPEAQKIVNEARSGEKNSSPLAGIVVRKAQEYAENSGWIELIEQTFALEVRLQTPFLPAVKRAA